MQRLLIILLLIFGCTTAVAQVKISPEWTSLIERWGEQNETSTDELFELIYQLYENPINLNDTSKLKELFILDLPQQKAIKSYIIQYGPLYSIEELHVIYGFDSVTINLLRPITITQPVSPKEKLKFKKIIQHGHHNLVIGSGRNIEQSRGFNEDIYDGDPYRLYYRYYFKYQDKIQLMISGEKDPGESIFSSAQPQGFDFYGYHLLINDWGHVKRAIIGQYYLQFGQGLTLWTGFNPYNSTNVYRHSQGIRPAGVFTEYGYLNGIASTFAINKNIDISLFYSNVNRDATYTDKTYSSIQSIYNSGYHRTPTEINKKNNLNEQLWGTNIQYNINNLHLGTTFQQLLFNQEINPKPTPYNIYAFNGNKNINLGIDASYLWRYILIFSEFSISQNLGTAGIVGAQISLNKNTRVCTYYRNFSPKYQNLYATSIGQNSSPQNEEGIYLSLSTTLPYNISAIFSADIFRFPWLKYQVYSPSQGSEYQIHLTKNFINNFTIGTSYRFKEYGHNQKVDTLPNYLIEQNYRHRLQSYFEYATNSWHFVSRIYNTWYTNESHKNSSGILIGQDIQYTPQNIDLSITARIALFNATNYNARLYTVENNLQYEYNMNSFMDKGLRLYLVMHYNITSHISINAKYGITYYANKHEIGSGYNKISTNHLQNIKLQLRWKF